MREAEKTDFSLKTKDEKRSRVVNPTPPDPSSSLPADLLVTLPDRSCTGDPTYEFDRPQYYVFDRGSTWKQKVYELEKCMDDLLQLVRLCPLRDTEHSMSMNRTYHRAEHDDSRRWSQHGRRWRNTSTCNNIRSWSIFLKQNTFCWSVSRVDTKNNTADLFTKHLDGLRTRARAKKLGLRLLDWLMVVRTWIWLMVVRTRKTDDDNWQLLTSVCS